MKKVAHILVCHSVNPERLLSSIPYDRQSLWFVFFHGTDDRLADEIDREISKRRGIFFRYNANRGLARSWNEGLQLAAMSDCATSILLNDDLFFYPGAYSEFVETVWAVGRISDNVSFITVNGFESGASPYRGQTIPQAFACCAITNDAFRRIGCFDENFSPAYFEDVDFARRAALAGMTVHLDERTLVEHERSLTSRVNEEIAQNMGDIYEKNKQYFIKKWGGDDKFARFKRPFNNENCGLHIAFDNRANPYGLIYRSIPRGSDIT